LRTRLTGILIVLLAAAVTASVAVAQRQHSLDSCSSQGSNEACIYNDGYLDLWAQGTASNYWVTNTIWRGNASTVEGDVCFHNSDGNVGCVADTGDNPVSTYGPYGYSTGFCKVFTAENATCEVFNFHT